MSCTVQALQRRKRATGGTTEARQLYLPRLRARLSWRSVFAAILADAAAPYGLAKA